MNQSISHMLGRGDESTRSVSSAGGGDAGSSSLRISSHSERGRCEPGGVGAFSVSEVIVAGSVRVGGVSLMRGGVMFSIYQSVWL